MMQSGDKEGSNVVALQADDFVSCNRFGMRLIAAGLITPQQRDEIVSKQNEYREKGVIVRFGEVALLEGYCTRDQLENLPGYIGNALVQLGVITRADKEQILRWQYDLRAKGTDLRFGDIAVNEGYCTRDDVEMAAEAVSS